MAKFCLFFVILVSAHLSDSAKILGVFPTPSISHQIVFRALCEELARRGHHVTILTPNPSDNPPANYTQIDVHDLSYGISYEIWKKTFNFVVMGDQAQRPVNFYFDYRTVMLKIFEDQMNTPEMQKILQSNEQFDLILIEAFIPTGFALKERLKAPLIGVSSLTGTVSNFEAVGNPVHPIYYPDIFRKKLKLKTVLEKLDGLYDFLHSKYVDYMLHDAETALVRKLFGPSTRTVPEAERDMDMLFLNVNPIFMGIRPTVPSIVLMGGLHLQKKKPLPKDLKQILDESTQGVIYMSLGSNVLSKDLPKEKIQIFLDVFLELPYKILWKFESENITNVPDNVHLSKWYPQADLFGHPNMKLFITQGGQQSMEEAVRDAVPLLCLPFFGDQMVNAEKIVFFNIGVNINVYSLTKESLMEGIQTVVGNESYRESMQELSRVLSDRPIAPMDEAIWWAEYVIKNKGAKHLRSPVISQSYFEYFMIDLLLVLLGLILTICFAIRFILSKVFNMLRPANKLKKN